MILLNDDVFRDVFPDHLSNTLQSTQSTSSVLKGRDYVFILPSKNLNNVIKNV